MKKDKSKKTETAVDEHKTKESSAKCSIKEPNERITCRIEPPCDNSSKRENINDMRQPPTAHDNHDGEKFGDE